ncbi:hypothetical protein C8R44DRAFT_227028 [Mycena epipterygia]|nr:hypothetical protein C8R44DRAFT_227028 [Mycena epipterygia]
MQLHTLVSRVFVYFAAAAVAVPSSNARGPSVRQLHSRLHLVNSGAVRRRSRNPGVTPSVPSHAPAEAMRQRSLSGSNPLRRTTILFHDSVRNN